MRAAFDEYTALTLRLLQDRHGFAVYDETRNAEFREDRRWVAVARSRGEVVGAVTYQVEDFAGDLVATDLLTTGPLGRALLLQFFARHVDQVGRIVLTVGADDVPELWGTDLAAVTESRVSFPKAPGPMARVLDLDALTGIEAGDGVTTVEVVDDELIGGVYRLEGSDGRLAVSRGSAGAGASQVTAAGLSGLVYGVLDPIDVMTRGLGRIDEAAVEPLRAIFPKAMPYLFADF